MDDLERLKVKVTNGAVTAIGMCGYTPVGLTGVLVFFFVRRIFVTDISGVGWRRAMKFCRVVDLGVHQVISPFDELWPMDKPPRSKIEKSITRSTVVSPV